MTMNIEDEAVAVGVAVGVAVVAIES